MNKTKNRFLSMAVFLIVGMVLVLGAGPASQARASSVIFDYENGVLDSGAGTFTFDILVGDIGPLDNLDAWNLEFNITRQAPDAGVAFSFNTESKADTINNPDYVFFGNSGDWDFVITGGPATYNAFAGDLTVDSMGKSDPEGLMLATVILDDVEFCDWFDIDVLAANSFFLDSDGDFDSIPDGRFEVHVVPIPGALWLLGSGLIALVGFRRRSQKG